MKNYYIKIENLSKTIKGVDVLKDINLNLEKGKIYGFRGKNGSGKTMLFRAICGLIRPTKGKIIVNNQELGKDISFPQKLGILIEYPGFLEGLSGYKNLKYLSSIRGEINDKTILESIKKVGLDPNNNIKVKKYSLGMKQRLGLAQAIMENPDLLILDEPTNALDENGVHEINLIFKEFANEGKTILIASHDREELDLICDEVYTIHDGKITSKNVKGEKSNEY